MSNEDLIKQIRDAVSDQVRYEFSETTSDESFIEYCKDLINEYLKIDKESIIITMENKMMNISFSNKEAEDKFKEFISMSLHEFNGYTVDTNEDFIEELREIAINSTGIPEEYIIPTPEYIDDINKIHVKMENENK